MTPLPMPRPGRRRYLMCRPTYFAVEYAINPWMDPETPVDAALAVRQWEALRRVYLDLGHVVEEIDPLPGLPDMVFAANGATVIDGQVLAVQFRQPQRADEAPAYRGWFERAGFTVHDPKHVNEGEGDILLAGEVLLAGTGFRTSHAEHAHIQEIFGRPVITLNLVDPHFYHLDTALCVLDERTVAYLPEAFSPGSQAVLRRLFPDAVLATSDDARVFGLNAVSDGRHVVLPAQATGLADRLRERGYEPIGVDLSELRKAGGGPKCCTLTIREAPVERASTAGGHATGEERTGGGHATGEERAGIEQRAAERAGIEQRARVAALSSGVDK